jgi:hypothetical protein
MNYWNLKQQETARPGECISQSTSALKSWPTCTLSQFLLQGTGLVPIDNVDELPGILIQLELQLSLLVNHQLSRWV